MIYLLEGAKQDYFWGGKTFIAQLLNEPEQLIAELWLGSHNKAPAIIHDNGQKIPLNEWLGQKSASLPYLLKILDVRLPLSIQVHPDKKQAEMGFNREETLGVPLNSPERLYLDNNHKPEMMVALSDFWLLHGFASLEKIKANLLRFQLTEVWQYFLENDLLSAYEKIMRANSEQLAKWLLPIIEGEPISDLNHPAYWIQFSFKEMQMKKEQLDAGLMCFLIFNLLNLKKGEALVQVARLPHAYLRGQNIELMATSDNVLRAGLTPKHIALDELLKIIEAKSVEGHVFNGTPMDGGLHFPSGVADFDLSILQLKALQNWEKNIPNHSVLLALENDFMIQANNQELNIPQGKAVFVEGGTQIKCFCQKTSQIVYASY